MTKLQKIVLAIIFIILIVVIILNIMIMNEEPELIINEPILIEKNTFIDQYNNFDNLSNYEIELLDNKDIYTISDSEVLVVEYDDTTLTNVLYQVDSNNMNLNKLANTLSNMIKSINLDYSNDEVTKIIDRLGSATENEADELGTLLQFYDNGHHYLVLEKEDVYQYHIFVK